MTKFTISSRSALAALLFLGAASAASPRAFATATPWPAFVIVDNLKNIKKNVEIHNMPSVLDQGEFPICHAMAATTLIQFGICKTKNIAGCKNPPPEFNISPLSVTAWSNPATQPCTIENGVYRDKVLNQTMDPKFCGAKKSSYIASSYRSLGFSGNWGGAALMHSEKVFRFKTRSCYTEDALIRKHGKTKENLAAFEKEVETLYRNGKRKIENCESCLKTIADQANGLLDTNLITPALAKAALEKETEQEFLYALVFRDCPDTAPIPFAERVNYDFYPHRFYFKDQKMPESNKDVTDKIKEILDSGWPISIGGLCTEQGPTEECKVSHVAVIAGYRVVCDATGSTCKTLLKIQNSWGKEWHMTYGEWFDQDVLVGEAQKKIGSVGILTWVEHRELNPIKMAAPLPQ